MRLYFRNQDELKTKLMMKENEDKIRRQREKELKERQQKEREQREKQQKEKRRREDVHPDRVHITGPAPDHVFGGKKSRAKDQVFERAEEFSIEMGDVLEKMCDQVPDRLFGLNVLLPAHMAKPPLYFCLAIQAICFLPFLQPAHGG